MYISLDEAHSLLYKRLSFYTLHNLTFPNRVILDFVKDIPNHLMMKIL